MPLFTKGTATFRRFLALGPVPNEEKIREALDEDQFRPFQSGSEEVRSGWCDWRNPLVVPAEEDMPLMVGDWAHMGLRIDTRKVPASTMRAHLNLRMQRLMKEKDLAFLGKDARISLQDEIKAELLPKQTPTTKLVEVAWHLKSGVVMIGSTGPSVVGEITSLLAKHFGLEMKPFSPIMLASKVAPDVSTGDLEDLEPLALGANQVAEGARDVAMSVLGQEFAIWLWHRATAEGGTRVEDDGTAFFLDDSIEMEAAHGMAKKVSLKKGLPAESEAAFKALADGMKPTKVKAKILHGDQEWVFTMNTKTLDFGSMKLPPLKGSGEVGYAADRMFLIEEALAAFDGRFGEFIRERVDPDTMTAVLGEWVKSGAETAEVDEESGE
jgi:hypothetical protein